MPLESVDLRFYFCLLILIVLRRSFNMNRLSKSGYLLFLPAAFFFSIFYYWPLLVNVVLSFFSWNMVSSKIKFVGISNYTDIVQTAEFYSVIVNTVLFVLFLLIFNFVLPYIYSYI